MPKPAQHHASTQKFIEIQNIQENIVLFENGDSCIIIGVTATNFALLSKDEQDGKIGAYASLLNSLSFPIQILVKSKRIQMQQYLKLLENEQHKAANSQFSTYIQQYRNFVENLVTVSSVLEKNFYIVISYFNYVIGAANPGTKSKKVAAGYFEETKKMLHTKAETVVSLVEKAGLRAHIMEEDELVKLFYDIYNQGDTTFEGSAKDIVQPTVVQQQKTT